MLNDNYMNINDKPIRWLVIQNSNTIVPISILAVVFTISKHIENHINIISRV